MSEANVPTCKDCPINPLNDIKAEIEQKRSECDPNGDSSRLVRAGIDIALRVINKYMKESVDSGQNA